MTQLNKNKYSLLSRKFPNADDELPPAACEAPGFPEVLAPATAAPAPAAAAPVPPGGSANELVLGRPLPLIAGCECVGGQGEVCRCFGPMGVLNIYTKI